MAYQRSRKPAPRPRRYGIPVWLSLGLVVLMMAALTTRVWASATSGEVKRTARKLRITPETLQQARQALREVTELVAQLPTPPSDQIYLLASAWLRLNAPEAATQCERLFRTLRAQSERAEPKERPAIQSALAAVLQSLAFVDPERAWTLFQQWPAVPDTREDPAGEEDKERPKPVDRYRYQVQAAIIAGLSACDPDRAATLAQDMLREGPSAFMEQEGGMGALLLFSHPELSTQVAKESLKAFNDQPVTKENINKQMNFLHRLAWAEPDMVGPAARAMAQRLKAAEAESFSGRTMVLRNEENSAQLEGMEPMALDLIRSLREHPTVAVKLLEEFPSLAEKLSQIGGLDAVFRYGSRRSSTDGRDEEDVTPPRKRKNTDGPSPSPMDFLRGRVACPKQTEQWRSKIRELASSESGFDRLVAEAQAIGYNNPELAEEALRLAEGLVSDSVAPATRVERLVRLVGAYVSLDYEIDSNLIEKAFTAVKKMEEAPAEDTEKEKPPYPGFDRSGQFQTQLFSLLARSDFPRMMDRARTLPNGQQKVAAILGILQSLGGGMGFGPMR